MLSTPISYMLFLFLFQLQQLAVQLSDLWNLMDTPMEERSLFNYVTCNISSTVDEVTIPGSLALDLIEQVRKQHTIITGKQH